MEIKAPAIWRVLDYKPFPWQWNEIHTHEERFICGACARRTGKSSAARAEVWREVMRPPIVLGGQKHNRLVYVVAPDYGLAMKVFEPIYKDIVPDSGPLHSFFTHYDKDRMLIEMSNGARIQAKTGINPKALAGDAVTLAVVDEAHALSNEAMAELLPALSDLHGRMFAFGIPQADNWFRSMSMRGEMKENYDAEGSRYHSFSVDFLANPNNTRQEMDDMRASGLITEREWVQRYLAKWTDLEGSVFRTYDWCFDSKPEEKPERGPYIMGLDFAIYNDFTAAYVLDVSRMQVVAKDRFNKLDWPIAINRIQGLYEKFNCATSVTDTTALGGDALAHMMREAGIHVTDYVFTLDSKSALVTTLAAELEHRRLHLLKDDDTLKRELQMFRGEVTGAGKIKYAAATGFNDDTVFALAMAVWKAKKRPSMGRSAYTGSYTTWRSKEETLKDRMKRKENVG